MYFKLEKSLSLCHSIMFQYLNRFYYSFLSFITLENMRWRIRNRIESYTILHRFLQLMRMIAATVSYNFYSEWLELLYSHMVLFEWVLFEGIVYKCMVNKLNSICSLCRGRLLKKQFKIRYSQYLSLGLAVIKAKNR